MDQGLADIQGNLVDLIVDQKLREAADSGCSLTLFLLSLSFDSGRLLWNTM